MEPLEKIELLTPFQRKGPMMRKDHYEIFCRFIVAELEAAVQITLDDLLQKSDQLPAMLLNADTLWNLLQVKHDLQERGVIAVSHQRRTQIITLKKAVWKRMNSAGDVFNAGQLSSRVTVSQ
jgi:hypothetical protein